MRARHVARERRAEDGMSFSDTPNKSLGFSVYLRMSFIVQLLIGISIAAVGVFSFCVRVMY
jgi:hypothetical protein